MSFYYKYPTCVDLSTVLGVLGILMWENKLWGHVENHIKR